MKELDEIRNISAGFDIRAETLAVNLLAHAKELNEAIGIDQLMLCPIGNANRRFSNDVAEVKKKYFEHDTVLQVNVNRNGFFDTLPQGLFLPLNREFESPKKRTKAIEEQIKESRKFFLPFEQATYHPRIENEQYEQKYTEEFPPFIEQMWGLDKFEGLISHRQSEFLCHLLPEAHKMIGDWHLTKMVFERVLQKSIGLGFAPPARLEMPNANLSISEMKLGEDSVMGTSFRDEFPILEIEIQGVTHDELSDYLPKGKIRIVIEDLLCSYFIPVDVPYRIKIDLPEDSLGFDLGEMVLGFNTVLNRNTEIV